jgi:hypothetical protein
MMFSVSRPRGARASIGRVAPHQEGGVAPHGGTRVAGKMPNSELV